MASAKDRTRAPELPQLDGEVILILVPDQAALLREHQLPDIPHTSSDYVGFLVHYCLDD
jgi:hypothetical protein